MADYSLVDNSALPEYLFYPRKEYRKPPPGAFDIAVSVAQDVAISCRAYPAHPDSAWIIFFHGNGEVAGDYDHIAPLYNRQGLSLFVADYRGYGASGGEPTFTALVGDAHAVFKAARDRLTPKHGLWVMGRSLGSVAALELAFHYPESLKGMIIESGFISVVGLIDHLDLPSPANLSELERQNRQMVSGISIPALILHGEEDRLVPLDQGKELFQTIGSPEKEMVTIPRAGHNDIMSVGLNQYMQAIRRFVDRTG